MTESPVTYDVRDGVGWITLNRPAVLNALSTELAAALADHAETAAADPRARQVIVRGAGRAFCSGMDRTALAAGSIGEAFYRHWNRALDCLEDMPKITVAVLHGYSIGGGLQLALGCDLRLATDDAVLGLGATRHALVPDGAVLRLARVVGVGRAKELALLNDHISPAEARAMGLVNWVCAPADLERTLGVDHREGARRGPHRDRAHQAFAPRVVPSRPAGEPRRGAEGARRVRRVVGDGRGQPRVAREARGRDSIRRRAGPSRDG